MKRIHEQLNPHRVQYDWGVIRYYKKDDQFMSACGVNDDWTKAEIRAPKTGLHAHAFNRDEKHLMEYWKNTLQMVFNDGIGAGKAEVRRALGI